LGRNGKQYYLMLNNMFLEFVWTGSGVIEAVAYKKEKVVYS
jgi:hypothetical protein